MMESFCRDTSHYVVLIDTESFMTNIKLVILMTSINICRYIKFSSCDRPSVHLLLFCRKPLRVLLLRTSNKLRSETSFGHQ